MKDAQDQVLYVGKAGNLRRRVSSYFERPQDGRIEKLVSEIDRIDYEKTDKLREAERKKVSADKEKSERLKKRQEVIYSKRFLN